MTDTIEYLRIVGRSRLQTAVHHYQHVTADRRATLVATMHYGEPDYYSRLGELIAKRVADGAVVHCEGSRWLPCDSAAQQEQPLLDELRQTRIREEALVELLGWVGQAVAFGPPAHWPPHWQIHDMTDLEITRKIGMPLIVRMVANKQRLFGAAVDDSKAAARLRLMAAVVFRLAASPKGQARKPAPQDAVLIDARNAVALAAVAGTDRDTVQLLDPMHIPGLDAGLRQDGFTRTGTDWQTVMVLPRCSVALAQLILTRKTSRRTAVVSQ